MLHLTKKLVKKKTRAFFSRSVNHNFAKDISSNFDFSITNDLGKYLEIPFHYKRVIKAKYTYLVKKVQSKLQI